MIADAPPRRRRLARLIVVLIVVLAAMLGGASAASAHPTLLFTDPAADTAVPTSPSVVTLVFNETVTVAAHAITVLDSDGRAVPMGATTTAQDGHVVTARPTGALPPGTYLVRWQATGSDGDLVDDEFRFAVGTTISGGGTASGGQSISWAAAVLRWGLFAGLALALGGVVGERLTSSARAEKPTLPSLRSWAVPGALAGLAAVVGLAALLVTDTATASTLGQSRPGQLLLVEAAGLAIALGLAATRRRAWAVLPLVAVAAAEGVRSHANITAPGWGALVTGVHLAAVAIWIGALAHVAHAAVAWRQEHAALRWVLLSYLRLAAWVFFLAVGTGTILALLLVPLSTLLTTTYGQVLLIKLGLVAVASGLALTARLTLPRRERLPRVRTLTRAESSALVGVLVLSAVLVSAPTAGNQPPAAPPARGPVLPLGTMAGQVGVSTAASSGQLVVRLSTPRRGDYYAPPPRQDYTLSGQLSTGRQGSAPLAFRGCGQGCFVAAADWHDGNNVLTLRVEAPSWRGGTVSLLVPWPAQPGAEDLTRAVQA
ncbi:MAG: copper resistance protein CopC, partial [Actinobacteria bacterium]|nr:copper resistance protein CopC [Actinomycetota bacterium]